MNAPQDTERLKDWHLGTLDDGILAQALRCDADVVRRHLDAPGFRTEICKSADAGNAVRRLSGRARVGLAAAVAFNRVAGVPPEIASEVVGGAWAFSESIARTLDFVPRCARAVTTNGTEADPLMLFAPYASEEIPIPSVDEYLDLIDSRHLLWRKPKEDAYELVSDLHRISTSPSLEDGDQNERAKFLAILAKVREQHDQVAVWIGVIDQHGFHPSEDAPAGFEDMLADRIGGRVGTASLAAAYKTKVSVNLSLAARSMKRRALGLEVGGRDRPCSSSLAREDAVPSSAAAYSPWGNTQIPKDRSGSA